MQNKPLYLQFLPDRHYLLFQLFDWNSHNQQSPSFWRNAEKNISKLRASGFDMFWLPPCAQAASPEGYLPNAWYNLNTKYGKMSELKSLTNTIKQNNGWAIFDAVFNHRNGLKGWGDFRSPYMDTTAVTSDDEWGKGTGHLDTGKPYHASRDLDHTNKSVVQDNIIAYGKWLLTHVGFDGFRGDMVIGYAAKYFQHYVENIQPKFVVGEYWPEFDIHNPDASRQAICNWLDGCHGVSCAFDFTTKLILHHAVFGEYWRLQDINNNPAGLIGWWPERSVTFIDNHDTGRSSENSQNYAPFPDDKIILGYAYILTHPGVPCVYCYDYMHRGITTELDELIAIRLKHGIRPHSKVTILSATDKHYVAQIDKKIMLELGEPLFSPGQAWVLKIVQPGYRVWENQSTQQITRFDSSLHQSRLNWF